MLIGEDAGFMITFIISRRVMTEDTGVTGILKLEEMMVNDKRGRECEASQERAKEIGFSRCLAVTEAGRKEGPCWAWWGSARLGTKPSVICDALGLNSESQNLGFGVLPGGKFPGRLGRSCAWIPARKAPNTLKGQVAIWGLRELGLNKPDLAIMPCQAFCPGYQLLQTKSS